MTVTPAIRWNSTHVLYCGTGKLLNFSPAPNVWLWRFRTSLERFQLASWTFLLLPSPWRSAQFTSSQLFVPVCQPSSMCKTASGRKPHALCFMLCVKIFLTIWNLLLLQTISFELYGHYCSLKATVAIYAVIQSQVSQLPSFFLIDVNHSFRWKNKLICPSSHFSYKSKRNAAIPLNVEAIKFRLLTAQF